MIKISNATLLSSLALEEKLSQLEKQPRRDETGHLADDQRKFRVRVKSVRDRILSNIEKRANGCWVWLGAKYKFGHGKISIRDKTFQAHRVMFTINGGVIPDGLILDHQCNNPSCVNPDHLKPMTQRDNLLRADTFQGRNHKMTHCKRGHLLPIIPNKDGKRVCRECANSKRRKPKFPATQH